MLQLQANQQNGDGRRAGDQPAGQAKQHDLPGGHLAAIEAPVNLLSMGPLMRILPLFRHQRRGG